MTMVVTSYTPETGPVTGGTLCTVTGTGLSTCVAVLIGDNEAILVSAAATTVVFRTPHGDAVGNAGVHLFDGTNVVTATDPFVYTAVSAAEQLVTTLANKFRLDASANVATTWADLGVTDRKVRGIVTIKPGLAYTTEDDSDIDSGIDGSDLVTGRKATVSGTVKRGKGVTSGNYDPGQEILRLAAEAAGTSAALIPIRWYDRTGGPEAYTAFALVEWSPQGGNKTADKVDFTLNIQGRRTVITNPVIADASLAN
jgi:hypothetical protein